MFDAAANDPALYARSFADIYDAWYGALDNPADLVQAFRQRCAASSVIVELGSGTGRLAEPLHHAGYRVLAVDVSLPMLWSSAAGLDRIGATIEQLPLRSGCADAVFVAYNTLFNLTSRALQQSCFDEARRVLRPGGLFAIETFIASPGPATEHGITIKEHPTNPSARLAILSGPDPDDEHAIVGSHVELGAGTTCRPWRLAYQSPTELDASAGSSMFRLIHRAGAWSGSAFDADAHRQVGWYEAC